MPKVTQEAGMWHFYIYSIKVKLESWGCCLGPRALEQPRVTALTVQINLNPPFPHTPGPRARGIFLKCINEVKREPSFSSRDAYYVQASNNSLYILFLLYLKVRGEEKAIVETFLILKPDVETSNISPIIPIWSKKVLKMVSETE